MRMRRAICQKTRFSDSFKTPDVGLEAGSPSEILCQLVFPEENMLRICQNDFEDLSPHLMELNKNQCYASQVDSTKSFVKRRNYIK